MQALGLDRELVDAAVYERAIERFRRDRIALPTFAELTDPDRIPERIRTALAAVDPDAPHPLNLFRVHWFNDASRAGRVDVPVHLVLPPELTGVDAPIVTLLGDRFPMVRSHKVIAAYGVLAPRVVTGSFDPTTQRAVWPSTGNYCRGGVAISRIMDSRGVAVLPEGMSRERFEWLERWVVEPGEDIIRTPGTESNVKEIYDRCAELAREPDTVILNQFAEFGNHVAHYELTGRALERTWEHLRAGRPGLRLRAFVSASGSAGTLGAGDYLRERHGSLTVAAEALECPTLLLNGYGEHNIQGIGDKHVPLIHDVMATDVVVDVSDRATDALFLVFNTDAGRDFLERRLGVDPAVLGLLGSLGFSSICNVLGAIKTAKQQRLGPDDLIVTVATDGAELYATEIDRLTARDFPGGLDEAGAAEAVGRYLLGADTEHMLECTRADRDRIFNLGYYTWVEQQGVPLEAFEARRSPDFWAGLRELPAAWDERIDEFNALTGALEAV